METTELLAKKAFRLQRVESRAIRVISFARAISVRWRGNDMVLFCSDGPFKVFETCPMARE